MDQSDDLGRLCYKVFKYFNFLFIDKTKIDIKKDANRNGWVDILEMT